MSKRCVKALTQNLSFIYFLYHFQDEISLINKGHEEQKIVKESQQVGKVKRDVYKAYLAAVNNSFFVIIVIILFFITQALMSGVDYFVSIW